VVATLADGSPYVREVDEYVTLSNDWIEWKQKSIVKDGRSFQLYGTTRGGLVSRARSTWAGGVRIDSGKGSASVIYEFKAVAAVKRGWLSFTVLGKSPNGHKAVIAIHDPALGGSRYLASYDVARKIGPGYRWWNTGTPADGRKQQNKFRGAVVVAKGLGKAGPAVFDINKVEMTYEYAVLRSGPAPTLPGTAPATRPTVLSSSLKDVLGIGLPALTTPTPTPAPDPAATPTPTPAPDPEATPGPERSSTETDDPVMDNVAPLADAGGPYVVDEGGLVRLDGRGSADPDGRIVAWAWSQQAHLDDPERPRPRVAAGDDGDIEIELTVTDDQGAHDTATARIRIRNVEPVVDVPRRLVVTADEPFDLPLTIGDPGPDEHELRIDWGDGTSGTTTNHTYAIPGRYSVTVTATDDDGGGGTAGSVVMVKRAHGQDKVE
jgi:hypothetical protein